MEEATSELKEKEMTTDHNHAGDGHHAETAAAHGDAHGDAHAAPAEGNVFQQLLGALGDHHTFTLFNDLTLTELPVILYDNEEGVQFFPGVSNMTGYKMDHHTHKIVSAKNKDASVMDFSVTNYVVFEWLAMIIALLFFIPAGLRAKKNAGKAPKGIHNMMETLVVFLRDEVVVPNVNSRAVGYRLLPYFVGLFFFILFMNLLGLMPGGHTATSSVSITAALAITAYLVINVTQIKESGLGTYLKHLTGGAPLALAPIMIPIEIISMFVKPFALTIRLMANMTAGHVVLLSLVGLIFYFQSYSVAPISVAFSVFMYFLELLVAFLQAYIFTILTAVFTGLGVHSHDEHEHATEH